MTNLENSSELQLKRIPKWLVLATIIVAFIGLFDATYLTAEHYSGAGLNCVLFKGCDKVASSEYSEMFGLPVALYGMIFYLVILIIALLYADLSRDHVNPTDAKIIRTFKILHPKYLLFYGLIGFAMSMRFVYLQLAVIKAICTYCMLSATTSTLIFIFGIIIVNNRKKYFN